MVKTNVKLVDDVNREPPDIFRAAINDDVRELRAALSEGQSLDTPNRLHYGMTPVHLACAKHSLNFIDEALKETFNAWARDLGGRLSMDYAIRSEEHTSELKSPMRISYAVFCLKKK